jgi:hypothetical protein
MSDLRTLLIGEHRKAVAEHSGNMGGHVGIRDGWVEHDADTPTEVCEVCDAIIVAGTTPPPPWAAEAQELVEREGEPTLCWCGGGYVGHAFHPENELRSMGGDR